jgi:hypothetical protein
MSDLSDLQQAQKAIGHVLRQIRERSEIGWYLGHGTESFALLTEAAATLFGTDVEQVRKDFAPLNAANPVRDPIEAILSQKPELTEEETDLLKAVATHLGKEAMQTANDAGTKCDQCGYTRLMTARQLVSWSEDLELLAKAKGGA